MKPGMVLIARCIVLGALVWSGARAPALAVTSGGPAEPSSPSADDYGRGKAAFEREDWQGVIEHMTRAIEERPWHDDAHNLMGFAYRKLGDYDRALEAYGYALKLNPHHRGALEYLGEAYLELDQPQLAKEMLDRLEVECRRLAADASSAGWQSDCEEWQELHEAYEAYVPDRVGE